MRIYFYFPFLFSSLNRCTNTVHVSDDGRGLCWSYLLSVQSREGDEGITQSDSFTGKILFIICAIIRWACVLNSVAKNWRECHALFYCFNF